jgi:hypothetical protein
MNGGLPAAEQDPAGFSAPGRRRVRQDSGVSDVEIVRRWEQSGGSWQVLARRPGQLTVSLRRCDGGEEVQRLGSSEPELLAFIGNRASSEDDPC